MKTLAIFGVCAVVFLAVGVFGVFADTGGIVKVQTGSGYYGAFLPCNNQIVNMVGRTWIFYENDSGFPVSNYDFEMTSSADGGLTWATPTIVEAGAAWQYWRARSVFYNGTHIAYVVEMNNATAPNWRTLFRMGVPNADGTITWSSASTWFMNASTRTESRGIVQTTAGRWFVSYFNWTDSYFWVDSMIDTGATWVSDSGYPQALSAEALPHVSGNNFTQTSLLQLSGGQAFAVYENSSGWIYGRHFNGATWDAEEILSAQNTWGVHGWFAASVMDDVVYVAYATPSSVRLVVRQVGGALTEQLVLSSRSVPFIAVDHDASRAGTDYVFIYAVAGGARNSSAYWQYSKYNVNTGAVSSPTQLTSTGWFEGSSSAGAYEAASLWTTSDGLTVIYFVYKPASTIDMGFFSSTITSVPATDTETWLELAKPYVWASISLFSVGIVLAVGGGIMIAIQSGGSGKSSNDLVGVVIIVLGVVVVLIVAIAIANGFFGIS